MYERMEQNKTKRDWNSNYLYSQSANYYFNFIIIYYLSTFEWVTKSALNALLRIRRIVWFTIQAEMCKTIQSQVELNWAV